MASNLEKKPLMTKWLPIALLIISLFYGSIIYFSPGNVYNGDGNSHAARIHMVVYKCLKQGHWPMWSNNWYCGFPLAQFYSPLYFLSGAFFEFFTKDPILAPKITLFFAHFFSGIFIYILAVLTTRSKIAGIAAAFIYSLAPWHFYQMMIWSRHPASLIYTFLPLPFIAYELFKSQRQTLINSSIFAGASISLLILSHYGYALFCVYFFLIYVIFDIALIKNNTQKFIQRIKFILYTGIVSTLLCLFFILPAVMESSHVVTGVNAVKHTGFSVKDLATLKSLLSRQPYPAGHHGYIGIVSFFLSCMGLIFLVFRRWFNIFVGMIFSLIICLRTPNTDL